MSPTRREFIKRLGISLGVLLAARCKRKSTPVHDETPVPVTCYEPIIEPITLTPTAQLIRQTDVLSDVARSGDVNPEATRLALVANARERLYAAWSMLDGLAEQAAGEDWKEAESAVDRFSAEHRTALDDLVAADELSPDVANCVQMAYEEAAFHAWRNNAPLSCYEAPPVEYDPRVDLLGRAEALVGVSDVDPETVALARAALARDMAFFAALEADPAKSYKILTVWQEREIEVDPDAAEAAAFLVNLLLDE